MNRQLALTFAGATAIFVTAASAAVAANVGILNVGADKPVGQLTAANVGQLAVPGAGRATTASAVTGVVEEGSVSEPTPAQGATAPAASAGGPVVGPVPSASGSSGAPSLGISGSVSVAPSNAPTSPSGGTPASPSPTTPRVSSPPAMTPAPTTPTTSRSSERKTERERERESEREEDDDD